MTTTTHYLTFTDGERRSWTTVDGEKSSIEVALYSWGIEFVQHESNLKRAIVGSFPWHRVSGYETRRNVVRGKAKP